jgi:hypothetical protein
LDGKKSNSGSVVGGGREDHECAQRLGREDNQLHHLVMGLQQIVHVHFYIIFLQKMSPCHMATDELRCEMQMQHGTDELNWDVEGQYWN